MLLVKTTIIGKPQFCVFFESCPNISLYTSILKNLAPKFLQIQSNLAQKFLQNRLDLAPEFLQNRLDLAPKLLHNIKRRQKMANKYLKRNVDSAFLAWKNDKNHKSLLLRGARQVGKSSAVRNLAREFEYYIEVNFEENHEAHKIFGDNLDIKKICEEISALYNNTPIIGGKTLLFLDEIQSCPRAITALRYFYEKYPELHVVAAGSLLEFALQKLPSFGVGRIQIIFMYPLSFSEFLKAFGYYGIWDKVLEASPENPLFEPFHNRCLDYLKKYLIIGGMPEVVADYVENGQLLNSQKMLDNIVETLKSDFNKYNERVPEFQISTVFDAVISQNGKKFNLAKVEQLNHRQVKEGLNLLQRAGLIIPVIHSSANGIPLGGQINPKKKKYILLDTGILQRLLSLELSDILLGDDISVINKGAIAEQFAGLELLKSPINYSHDNLFFWLREKPGSTAEVDYVIQKNGKIIPIEVKSGTTGKMQSMHIFLNEKNLDYGIRTSLENFKANDKIRVYPLYAIGNI
jgi:predicted AAA+ superfamily ATPase